MASSSTCPVIPPEDVIIVMKNGRNINDSIPETIEIVEADEDVVLHGSEVGVEDSGNEGYKRRLRSGLLIREVSVVEEDDSFLGDGFDNEHKIRDSSPKVIIQWLWLTMILAVGGLVSTLTIKELKVFTISDLQLWKWELLFLIVVYGRLISGCGISIVLFFVTRMFSWRTRALYFVYYFKNSIRTLLWLVLVLVVWQFICYRKLKMIHGKRLFYVTRVLICLVVGQCIWGLKTWLVKFMSTTFLVDAFFDRIHELVFSQCVIQRFIGRNGERENVDSWIRGDNWGKVNKNNILPWNMKKLIKIAHQCVLSNFLQWLQESTIEEESERHVCIVANENQAMIIGERIFNKVSEYGSEYIFFEDLKHFMKEDEALHTLRMFKAAENRGISKNSLQNLVVNLFRERRDLASALNNTTTTLNKVNKILNYIVVIIVFVTSVLILGVVKSQSIIFIGSQILLIAFIFGNTFKTIFEALVFLFVMHPYDVGDLVEIDGVQMIVKEMNILTTIFLKFNRQEIIYPNNILATKSIINDHHNPNMSDEIDFCIHIKTPAETIAKMKERITSYINSKSDLWYPAPMIVMKDVEELNRIKCSILVPQTMNFLDIDERHMRRDNLIEEMTNILKELDIEYRV